MIDVKKRSLIIFQTSSLLLLTKLSAGDYSKSELKFGMTFTFIFKALLF